MSDEVEYTENGDPIIKYGEREGDFVPPTVDDEAMEAIDAHIERFYGKQQMVFHEILSDIIHVDIYHVMPTDERPYHTLMTSGMSSLPMAVPEQAGQPRYLELMICLPAGWPLDEASLKREEHYWPIRWLKILARFPFQYDTWLGWGHTLPNGDPAEPFACNTKLCCALLVNPVLPPHEFCQVTVNTEKTVHFLALLPLYEEEMHFKLRHGTEPLLKRLAGQGTTELLKVNRENVCRKKFLGLF
jgi:hypothetical protein